MTDSSKVPIVLDTTFLIAANSDIVSTDLQFRDPGHKSAFKCVTTLLCNSYPIQLIRPNAEVRTRNTFLYLLSDDSKLINVTNPDLRVINLNPIGERESYDALAASFEVFFEDSLEDVSKWLNYQFGDEELVDIFWDGGDEQFDRLKFVFGHLKRNKKIFDKCLLSWQEKSSLPLFMKEHEANYKRLGSKHEYTLAYCFFTFTKGYHYLLNMQKDEFGIMPHWMKAQALPPSLAQAYDKGRKAEEFL